MTDSPAVALILDESKWFTFSMAVAIAAVCLRLVARRREGPPRAIFVLELMCLFAGVMVGVMAGGHLLAVGIKALAGSLAGSLVTLVPLGLALGVPAWLLARAAGRHRDRREAWKREVTTLNAFLVTVLLLVGLPNLPLAGPSLFAIGYRLRPDGPLGWVIVTTALVAIGGLFAGSVVFFLSGQTFEQFREP